MRNWPVTEPRRKGKKTLVKEEAEDGDVEPQVKIEPKEEDSCDESDDENSLVQSADSES